MASRTNNHMKRQFTFKESVRIYDTDAQGIVHYAGYYRFFTDALEQFVKERIGGTFPLLAITPLV